MALRLAARERAKRQPGVAPAAARSFGFGARTIIATEATMIPPPTSVRQPSGSPRKTVPSRTATTGFT